MPNESLKFSAAKVNLGSGCLFQPLSDNHTYVLTARHCIIDPDAEFPYERVDLSSIEVYALSESSSQVRLSVIDYFISHNPDIDTAIIIVEKVTGSLQDIHCDYPDCGEEAFVFGYPSFRNEAVSPIEYLTCIIRLISTQEMTFDVDSTSALFSFSRGAIENSKGFSGSGIYVGRGENVLLVGILVKIKNPDGIFDRLSAFGIEHYNQLLAANSTESHPLAPLIPECLASFSTHLSSVFQYDNRRLQLLMLEAGRNIVSKGINPHTILKKFNEKLFIPYNKKNSFINNQLWQGWLELLTFISLEKEDINSMQDIPWANRYFFYIGDGSWKNIVKYMHVDMVGHFKTGSKFIFNNNHSSPEPPKPTQKQVSRMLPNIASGDDLIDVAGKVNIDQSQIGAQFLFIHLQEFKRAFSEAEEDLLSITETAELKTKIQGLLNKVFSNV